MPGVPGVPALGGAPCHPARRRGVDGGEAAGEVGGEVGGGVAGRVEGEDGEGARRVEDEAGIEHVDDGGVGGGAEGDVDNDAVGDELPGDDVAIVRRVADRGVVDAGGKNGLRDGRQREGGRVAVGSRALVRGGVGVVAVDPFGADVVVVVEGGPVDVDVGGVQVASGEGVTRRAFEDEGHALAEGEIEARMGDGVAGGVRAADGEAAEGAAVPDEDVAAAIFGRDDRQAGDAQRKVTVDRDVEGIGGGDGVTVGHVRRTGVADRDGVLDRLARSARRVGDRAVDPEVRGDDRDRRDGCRDVAVVGAAAGGVGVVGGVPLEVNGGVEGGALGGIDGVVGRVGAVLEHELAHRARRGGVLDLAELDGQRARGAGRAGDAGGAGRPDHVGGVDGGEPAGEVGGHVGGGVAGGGVDDGDGQRSGGVELEAGVEHVGDRGVGQGALGQVDRDAVGDELAGDDARVVVQVPVGALVDAGGDDRLGDVGERDAGGVRVGVRRLVRVAVVAVGPDAVVERRPRHRGVGVVGSSADELGIAGCGGSRLAAEHERDRLAEGEVEAVVSDAVAVRVVSRALETAERGAVADEGVAGTVLGRDDRQSGDPRRDVAVERDVEGVGRRDRVAVGGVARVGVADRHRVLDDVALLGRCVRDDVVDAQLGLDHRQRTGVGQRGALVGAVAVRVLAPGERRGVRQERRGVRQGTRSTRSRGRAS